MTGIHNQYPFAFKKIFLGPSGEMEFPYPILGLYDKQNDDFFLVATSNVDDQSEPTGIENDIDGGINFMPMYAPNENLLVGWFESSERRTAALFSWSSGYENECITKLSCYEIFKSSALYCKFYNSSTSFAWM
jgi:hypothetical protein